MSDYPTEQYESEYLHTAILEYQRDVKRLTVELSAAQARIAELEAAPTPLPRPDKPGWWWCWEPDRKMWRIGWAKMEWPADNEDAKEKELVWWSPACGYDADKINRTILIGSQWLPATPPPAPKNEEGQG